MEIIMHPPGYGLSLLVNRPMEIDTVVFRIFWKKRLILSGLELHASARFFRNRIGRGGSFMMANKRFYNQKYNQKGKEEKL